MAYLAVLWRVLFLDQVWTWLAIVGGSWPLPHTHYCIPTACSSPLSVWWVPALAVCNPHSLLPLVGGFAGVVPVMVARSIHYRPMRTGMLLFTGFVEGHAVQQLILLHTTANSWKNSMHVLWSMPIISAIGCLSCS